MKTAPFNVPFVKDPDNLKWLEENEDLFRDFISRDSSVFSLVYALLHNDIFNDDYINTVRKKLYTIQKKIVASEVKIKKQVKANKPAEKKEASSAEHEIVAEEIETKIKKEWVEFND